MNSLTLKRLNNLGVFRYERILSDAICVAELPLPSAFRKREHTTHTFTNKILEKEGLKSFLGRIKTAAG